MMISSRLGELLYVTTGYTLPHVSLLIFDVLEHRYSRYPIMNRQSLPTSPLFQSDPKNEKEIRPELNHDYISYSDIKRFKIDEIVEGDL